MLWNLFLTFLVFWFRSICADEENSLKNPILSIANGKIRGRRSTTVAKGNTYYAFQGIPFAEPPVGELRFKAPVKKSDWKGVIDATQDKSGCVQSSNPVQGSEDCLFMNVYTPNLSGKNLTVMVYIYGGGFTAGSSTYDDYGPDYLLDEGVIVAIFNYRLGVLGFLSTEDTVMSGNIGLRDQILALKWVKANIRYFGGDPEKVTIFGNSAGAASIAYLLQIKSTKGLYRSAILQSGTSLGLWALNRRAKQTAIAIGKKLGISASDSKTLVEGLTKIDYKTLQTASVDVTNSILVENNFYSGLQFGPVKELPHKDALFHTNSDEELSQGNFHRVPILMGMNSNEGAFLEDFPELANTSLQGFSSHLTQVTPADLTDNQAKIIIAAVAIRLQYFGSNFSYTGFNEAVKFLTDNMFVKPIRKTAYDVFQYTSGYFYEFSRVGKLGGRPNRTLEGVSHAEEIAYIFRKKTLTSTNRNDILTRSRVVKMWTNFAKYLNPTPFKDPLLQGIKWPMVSSKNAYTLPYLNINTTLRLEENPFVERMRFWHDLYRFLGDPPYDTY